jgi:hypothetical protein
VKIMRGTTPSFLLLMMRANSIPFKSGILISRNKSCGSSFSSAFNASAG